MKLFSLEVFALTAAITLTPAANAQGEPPPAGEQSPPAVPAAPGGATASTPAPLPAPTPTVDDAKAAPSSSAAPPAAPPPADPAQPAPPAAPAPRTGLLNVPAANHQLALHAELGLLWPASHTIQFGREGSRIDYVTDGGQENLFPFLRISADLELFKRHEFVLLYQPLQLVTTQTAREEIRVYNTRYAAGTPMRFTYGFDFWRLSYLYDFNDAPETEIAIGASLQIRNATIITEAVDGSQSNETRNIGPVPVLKGRFRTDLGTAFWVGAEADGFYAPIRYLNGGATDVVGAIVDASLRGGLHLTPGVDTFLNLRYLGGGASGTSRNSTEPGDGFTDNWLHFFALTLGFTLR